MEQKKDGDQEDNKNIPYDDDVEYDEVDDLNEDKLHLRSELGDNTTMLTMNLNTYKRAEV